MTNKQSPMNEAPQRARYERPVVIELNLSSDTNGKPYILTTESGTLDAPS